MDQIIDDFLIESHDELDRLDQHLLVLRERPDDPAAVPELCRALHALEGTGGFLAFDRLEQVAQAGSALLRLLRDGELTLTSAMVDALEATADQVRELLGNIGRTGDEGQPDVRPLIDRLTLLAATNAPGPRATVATPFVADPAAPMGPWPADRRRRAEELATGSPLTDSGRADPGEMETAAPDQRAGCADGALGIERPLLDRLATLVEELASARNNLLRPGRDPLGVDPASANRLDTITNQLQQTVLQTRVQALDTIWKQLPEMVRHRSNELGKMVRVELMGQRLELERATVEALRGPIAVIVDHLIEHGVEKPEERVEAGKDPEGVIRLRAEQRGRRLIIEISDDGRSEPGAAPSKEPSGHAGREGAMAELRADLQRFGAAVEVRTEEGRSPTFIISTPLTLAVVPALLVSVAGTRYAIAQREVIELVRLDGRGLAGRIEELHGAPVFRRGSHLLPIVDLRLELGVERPSRDVTDIVVLDVDGRRFGLVVDTIDDTQDLGVEPLDRGLEDSRLFCGATIMGDGNIVLVLDVFALARSAGVVEVATGMGATDLAADIAPMPTDPVPDDRTFVVVGLDGHRRVAIALAPVERLEVFPAELVERAGNRHLVPYGGQILPLVDLGATIGMGGPIFADATHIGVVVCTINGQTIGLAVREVVDIVADAVVLTSFANSSEAVLVDGRITGVIDVAAVVSSVVPTGDPGAGDRVGQLRDGLRAALGAS